MDEHGKPSQMETARAYLGAFIVGGLVVVFPVGLVLIAIVPRDQNLIVAATLMAGAAGGLTAASVTPLRRWIAGVIYFFHGW
jgi:hypothetical protein